METSSYFEDTKELINPTMHKFLYILMKYMIFGERINKKTIKKLQTFAEKYKIQLQIDFISPKNNWTIENLNEFILLVKKQSLVFSSEIIENMLIRLFSFAFFPERSEFFGKHVYNNLKSLRKNKMIFNKWIDNNLLNYIFNEKDSNFDKILEYDCAISSSEGNLDIVNEKYPEASKLSTIIRLLISLHYTRFLINLPKDNSKFNRSEMNTSTTLNSVTRDGNYSSIYYNASLLYYSNIINLKEKDTVLPFFLSTLISSYIYNQNRKSSLMKFSDDSPNLAKLPYIYELSEAAINDLYMGTVLKPIRIEPRVCGIRMNKNDFAIEGILELHKLMIFNKNIKEISVKSSGIKSKNLKTFGKDLKLFDNKSIEELDMSSNYIKSDAEKYLAKLISKLKGLKTFTLSFNTLKSGAAAFFATLKNLYRQKKTKLETLILNKCRLDDISFYELGEMLKSKYCKLKCLCLSLNDIPSNVNFFESLKKNRSLKEIYLYGCGIKNENVDAIDRIISNSNLESLYLYVNKIHDFNQYIRIIYRNSLIKCIEEEKQKENIICDSPCLYNLNMNEADCYNRNSAKIKLLKGGIEKTNLSILDLTSVLSGFEIIKEGSKEYFGEVQKIRNDLQKQLDDYKKALTEILHNNVDKEELEKMISEKNKKEFEKLEELEKIINDSNSKNKLYIRKSLNEMFKNDAGKKIKIEQCYNYINFKRAEKNLIENEKIVKNKKMILI